MSKVTGKYLGVLTPLLAMILVLALGCGTSSDASQSTATDGPALPAMGTQVGDRIHPFAMRLADGTTVTSASLLSRDRPTFLLYFKHP